MGNSGIRNQIFLCENIISLKFSEFVFIIIEIIIKPIDIS